MTQAFRLTTRGEREALRSIRMVCSSGLDSVTLREEVCRIVKTVIASDACLLIATDPDTGLFTHGWVDGLPDSLARTLITELHEQEIAEHLYLARSGLTTSSRNSGFALQSLRAEGLECRARTTITLEDDVWGAWSIFREKDRPFTEKELHFLRMAAPHIGRGMRSASRLEPRTRSSEISSGSSPGVLVLDECRQTSLRTGPAAAHLRDLATIGVSRDLLPYAVMSVITQLGPRNCYSSASANPTLRAQGSSGEWYTLRASLAEPDSSGMCASITVIEPTSRSGESESAWRHYGLTPREREVVRLVLDGLSTKQIAARLHLSAYTVQDHLTNACEKVDVRGRHALLAKLYGAGYRPEPASSPLAGTKRT
ncbi:LuxR C-terminal-related transcriptional regulator [soil metagenome]